MHAQRWPEPGLIGCVCIVEFVYHALMRVRCAHAEKAGSAGEHTIRSIAGS